MLDSAHSTTDGMAQKNSRALRTFGRSWLLAPLVAAASGPDQELGTIRVSFAWGRSCVATRHKLPPDEQISPWPTRTASAGCAAKRDGVCRAHVTRGAYDGARTALGTIPGTQYAVGKFAAPGLHCCETKQPRHSHSAFVMPSHDALHELWHR